MTFLYTVADVSWVLKLRAECEAAIFIQLPLQPSTEHSGYIGDTKSIFTRIKTTTWLEPDAEWEETIQDILQQVPVLVDDVILLLHEPPEVLTREAGMSKVICKPEAFTELGLRVDA